MDLASIPSDVDLDNECNKIYFRRMYSPYYSQGTYVVYLLSEDIFVQDLKTNKM